MLKNNTAPYRPLESFIYDRVIAPAVIDITQNLIDDYFSKIPTNARVLDIGSGGGQMAMALSAMRPDLAVTGIDLVREQVNRALKRCGSNRANLRFLQGSALDIPFEAGSFDVVYSIGAIKHWSQPQQGLSECMRVLKETGRLIISEVDKSCAETNIRGFISHWRLPAVLRPMARVFFKAFVANRAFTLAEIKAMFDNIGVQGAEVKAIPDTIGWVAEAEKI